MTASEKKVLACAEAAMVILLNGRWMFGRGLAVTETVSGRPRTWEAMARARRCGESWLCRLPLHGWGGRGWGLQRTNGRVLFARMLDAGDGEVGKRVWVAVSVECGHLERGCTVFGTFVFGTGGRAASSGGGQRCGMVLTYVVVLVTNELEARWGNRGSRGIRRPEGRTRPWQYAWEPKGWRGWRAFMRDT